MKISRTITHCALCVAVVAAPALADETRGTAPAVSAPAVTRAKDVALMSGGVMRGVALNTAAKPIANADVRIQFGSHVVARTKTNADGSFVVSGLRGGIHTVSVGSQTSRCRLWTENVAPRGAIKVIAFNGSTDNVVRGQYIPPVDMGTVAIGLGALGIGLIIGKQIGDGDGRRRSPVSSP